MQFEILVFEIEGQQFAVPALDVVEVLRAATPSPIPNAPPIIDGVLNLRGHLVPLLNTHRLLGLPVRGIRHTDHFIVVQAGKHWVSLRVDRAIDLVRLESEESETAESNSGEDYLVSHTARTSAGLVHVIDTSRLLSGDETAAVVEALAHHSATEVTH